MGNGSAGLAPGSEQPKLQRPAAHQAIAAGRAVEKAGAGPLQLSRQKEFRRRGAGHINDLLSSRKRAAASTARLRPALVALNGARAAAQGGKKRLAACKLVLQLRTLHAARYIQSLGTGQTAPTKTIYSLPKRLEGWRRGRYAHEKK